MIRQHNQENQETKSTRRQQRNKRISAREIKLSKSLFVVVFAFMMCWAPFWIIIVFKRFRVVAKMARNVQLFCLFLLYLSNTINPFIYAGMNPLFRREVRRFLSCNRKRSLTLKPRKPVQQQDSGVTSTDITRTPNGSQLYLKETTVTMNTPDDDKGGEGNSGLLN